MKYEEASRIKDTLDLIRFPLSVTIHQEAGNSAEDGWIDFYLRIE